MIVHIGRRTFLGAIGGAAVAWPVAVRSQVAATERRSVGWLSGSESKMAKFFADDFLDGMREFGYVDGRDFDFIPRYAEGFADRLPALAQGLIGLKPAVIVAAAVNAAVPLRAATSVIPIVWGAQKGDFNITLERLFDPTSGQVNLLPEEITRVLLNLISNSS